MGVYNILWEDNKQTHTYESRVFKMTLCLRSSEGRFSHGSDSKMKHEACASKKKGLSHVGFPGRIIISWGASAPPDPPVIVGLEASLLICFCILIHLTEF